MDGNDPKSKAKETKETPEGVKSNGGILYPNIVGSIGYIRSDVTKYQHKSGAFHSWSNTNGSGYTGNNTTKGAYCNFSATQSNALFGKSSTVQPSAYRVHYLIKF